MNASNIVTRARRRPYLSVALTLAALLLVWYLLSLLVGQYELSASSYGKLNDYPGGWDEQHRIILDDALVSAVTPKLKQVLVNAPYVDAPVEQCNCALISVLELDQINKMLASTDKGKQLIAEGWDNDYNRGELLYPSTRIVGLYGYNGVAYLVSVGDTRLAFPFYTTGEFGWLATLWNGFFFGVAACSGTVVGQTILGLRRKEFVGGKVDGAYLVCIVGLVAFVFALWFFIIARLTS